jgi:hypothetical protein
MPASRNPAVAPCNRAEPHYDAIVALIGGEQRQLKHRPPGGVIAGHRGERAAQVKRLLLRVVFECQDREDRHGRGVILIDSRRAPRRDHCSLATRWACHGTVRPCSVIWSVTTVSSERSACDRGVTRILTHIGRP